MLHESKGDVVMSQTQPIKNVAEMKQFRDYYLYEHFNLRNYTMIVIGLNTALRVSDLLSLHWENVWDFPRNQFRKHIEVVESKTGKTNRIAINTSVQQALLLYKDSLSGIASTDFLFPSPRDNTKPLSRYQAFRIVKRAAESVGIEGVISCHSMRKTFGYQASKQGVPPALLMNIYNHSSYQITKRYLDIDQDDKDEAFCKINL
jgi:integrase